MFAFARLVDYLLLAGIVLVLRLEYIVSIVIVLFPTICLIVLFTERVLLLLIYFFKDDRMELLFRKHIVVIELHQALIKTFRLFSKLIGHHCMVFFPELSE